MLSNQACQIHFGSRENSQFVTSRRIFYYNQKYIELYFSVTPTPIITIRNNRVNGIIQKNTSIDKKMYKRFETIMLRHTIILFFRRYVNVKFNIKSRTWVNLDFSSVSLVFLIERSYSYE